VLKWPIEASALLAAFSSAYSTCSLQPRPMASLSAGGEVGVDAHARGGGVRIAAVRLQLALAHRLDVDQHHDVDAAAGDQMEEIRGRHLRCATGVAQLEDAANVGSPVEITATRGLARTGARRGGAAAGAGARSATWLDAAPASPFGAVGAVARLRGTAALAGAADAPLDAALVPAAALRAEAPGASPPLPVVAALWAGDAFAAAASVEGGWVSNLPGEPSLGARLDAADCARGDAAFDAALLATFAPLGADLPPAACSSDALFLEERRVA
jgi:hypothetical protein